MQCFLSSDLWYDSFYFVVLVFVVILADVTTMVSYLHFCHLSLFWKSSHLSLIESVQFRFVSEEAYHTRTLLSGLYFWHDYVDLLPVGEMEILESRSRFCLKNIESSSTTQSEGGIVSIQAYQLATDKQNHVHCQIDKKVTTNKAKYSSSSLTICCAPTIPPQGEESNGRQKNIQRNGVS